VCSWSPSAQNFTGNNEGATDAGDNDHEVDHHATSSSGSGSGMFGWYSPCFSAYQSSLILRPLLQVQCDSTVGPQHPPWLDRPVSLHHPQSGAARHPVGGGPNMSSTVDCCGSVMVLRFGGP